MCRGFAQAGARVLVNGRNGAKAAEFAKALCEEGLHAEAMPFDVTDAESVDGFVGKLGHLDFLVNNAVAVQPGTIAATPASAFGAVAATSAQAAYALTKAALPLMRRNGGSVINIASMYGIVSPDPRV